MGTFSTIVEFSRYWRVRRIGAAPFMNGIVLVDLKIDRFREITSTLRDVLSDRLMQQTNSSVKTNGRK